MRKEIDLEKLKAFIDKSGANTYSGGGEYEKVSERSGFYELTYSDGSYTYRDSYTGFYRSWGSEVVRLNDKPVWCTNYGGGMTEGNEEYAHETFEFLKKAMRIDTPEYSARGPKSLKDSDWEYSYKQEGDITNFSGYEEIKHKGELYFWHRILGGLIIDK